MPAGTAPSVVIPLCRPLCASKNSGGPDLTIDLRMRACQAGSSGLAALQSPSGPAGRMVGPCCTGPRTRRSDADRARADLRPARGRSGGRRRAAAQPRADARGADRCLGGGAVAHGRVACRQDGRRAPRRGGACGRRDGAADGGDQGRGRTGRGAAGADGGRDRAPGARAREGPGRAGADGPPARRGRGDAAGGGLQPRLRTQASGHQGRLGRAPAAQRRGDGGDGRALRLPGTADDRGRGR